MISDGDDMDTVDPSFAIEYFDDGALILKTDDARMIRVNAAGATILRLAGEGQTDEEIAASLCRLSDLDVDEARLAVASVWQQIEAYGVNGRIIKTGEWP